MESNITLPDLSPPLSIGFFDFDGTYACPRVDDYSKNQISQFEKTLFELSEIHQVLIGLITGSTINALERKIKERGLSYPHFASTSLGSELYFYNGRELVSDESWLKECGAFEFSKEKIENIIRRCCEEDSRFKNQGPEYNSKYKCSYYYFGHEERVREDQNILNNLKDLTLENNIQVHISKCNPDVGDPEGAYDIDFVPIGASKSNVLKFICHKYSISPKDCFAVGDSLNDLDMLQEVGHPFLVENAVNEEVLNSFDRVKGKYFFGVQEAMKRFIER